LLDVDPAAVGRGNLLNTFGVAARRPADLLGNAERAPGVAALSHRRRGHRSGESESQTRADDPAVHGPVLYSLITAV
jgi:hypothetical protein